MFALKERKDRFRLIIPQEFIPDSINEKYTKILSAERSFIYKPIDFLNETVQKVDILGVKDASVVQEQPGGRGEPLLDNRRKAQNDFMYPINNVTYRGAQNPLSLVDKTINITFKHTLGYLNYFIIFESFLYLYSRDMKYKNMPKEFIVDLFDIRGSKYARLHLYNPIIDGIDMLSLDSTAPVAESDVFTIIVKYSNFDYEFIYDDALDTEE